MVRDTCFRYRVAIHISTYTDPSDLSGVMVKVFPAVAVERGFDLLPGWTKDYIIIILSTQHDGVAASAGFTIVLRCA